MAVGGLHKRYSSDSDEINKSLGRKEVLAVSRIKANPKYFLSYSKSLSKLKSSDSMLFTSDGSITNNSSKMADILQNQFTYVFSDPNAPNFKAPDLDVPSIKEQSNELGFYMTDEHAIAAIDKIYLIQHQVLMVYQLPFSRHVIENYVNP